ncbi:NAD(P)/FAD-dependent oxidoreductase [Floridanema evergladense]|uniref:NAD(P)/FAD-dependent oxidoreductase n=1 Tax=Floridaenema evergladense BLCC-F167 TaxID=3153639 RepID=A0ABV4WSG6_9CYAN
MGHVLTILVVGNKETVINSFLGYASRWYQQTEHSEFDWIGIIISAQPPKQKRGGVIYPVEGNRWVVTLSGIALDYPPTDEAGFLEFARSLQSPIIYETIRNAQPLSEIYGFRATENRLRHYEKLSKYPDGLLAVGDAVCAFNPVYGQGMTVAAIGALTLDECLSRKHSRNYHLSRHYYKQLAQHLQIPYV